MISGQPMWRLTYSPAPESGIRSTLQPNSPIYKTNRVFEEEYISSSSPPNSPPHSSETASPVEDSRSDYSSDDGTPIPEPALQQPAPGPSRIYLRVPRLESRFSVNERPKITIKASRRTTPSAEPSTFPSPMSSRSNSQNLDSPDFSALGLQAYVVDENGQKRYPCLRCDKQFGRSHDRKRHMEESTSCRGGTLGREMEGEIAPTPMWVCEKCGDSFSRRDSMNRHMKNPDACKAYKRLVGR